MEGIGKIFGATIAAFPLRDDNYSYFVVVASIAIQFLFYTSAFGTPIGIGVRFCRNAPFL